MTQSDEPQMTPRMTPLIPPFRNQRTLGASTPRESEPKNGRHSEPAKNLQLFVCSSASACSEPRSAPSRMRGGERQTIGDPSQAQDDGPFFGSLSREAHAVGVRLISRGGITPSRARALTSALVRKSTSGSLRQRSLLNPIRAICVICGPNFRGIWGVKPCT